MSEEDIPQSVVEVSERALAAHCTMPGPRLHQDARDAVVAALHEYERLGYRLVRDDETCPLHNDVGHPTWAPGDEGTPVPGDPRGRQATEAGGSVTWREALVDAFDGVDRAYAHRKAVVQAAYDAGLRLRQIGDAVGLSTAGVHKIVGKQRADVSLDDPQWLGDDDD